MPAKKKAVKKTAARSKARKPDVDAHVKTD